MAPQKSGPEQSQLGFHGALNNARQLDRAAVDS
jgi:hypothetical protein